MGKDLVIAGQPKRALSRWKHLHIAHEFKQFGHVYPFHEIIMDSNTSPSFSIWLSKSKNHWCTSESD